MTTNENLFKKIEQAEKKLLLSEKEIKKRVCELGEEITKDFYRKRPILVGVLTGSFLFMADLCREINLNCEITFLQIASYHDKAESSGRVTLLKDISSKLEGRDLILVEDIIDSGLSLNFLEKHLLKKKPNSLCSVCLLKKTSAHKVPVKTSYTGFCIKDEFVIGYGLDFAGYKRNLKGIYTVIL